MRKREMVAALVGLGLDEGEATVYVELLQAGPCKASDVASRAGLGRSKAYRVLDSLARSNLVTASLSRPTEYAARRPEELFTELKARTHAQLRQVEDAESELGKPLEALAEGDGGSAPRNRWRVLQGRPRILRVAAEVMARAEEEFLVLSSRPYGVEQTMEIERMRDAGMERVAEGLRVRGLYHTTAETRERLQEELASARGVQLRHLDAGDLAHFVVGDQREVVLWLVIDPSARYGAEGDVAIWSDATELVSTLRVLFDFAWAASSDLDALDP